MPRPKTPPLPPNVNRGAPGRPMAAHVQKAVMGPLQGKLQPPAAGGGQVASHVQAAIAAGRGVGVQPRPAGIVGDGGQVAEHVQRAGAGAMQSKVPGAVGGGQRVVASVQARMQPTSGCADADLACSQSSGSLLKLTVF